MLQKFIKSTLICSITLSLSLLTKHTPLLAACPELYSDKIADRGHTSKIVIETGNGKKLTCKVKNTKKYNLNFARICPNNITIYSSFEAGDVKIEKNGKVSNYKSEFSGDKYQCTSKGQTYIKKWIYRNGSDIFRETSYDYSPYR
jgi:hypothetical protein